MERDNMRDHMRPMHNQADDKIYESEQRENTKRHKSIKIRDVLGELF